MSHFPTSELTTAFYPKLGCIHVSLQKLEMLTPVHNDAYTNDADDTNNANNYNMVIDIALLVAFSCANSL